jgi:dTDP-4-amino-4,6-dideoxygalactose transaminase
VLAVPPELDPGHVYHLFPALSPMREAIRERLRVRGIETLVHYPVPMPKQPAFAAAAPADCPAANRACEEVLSLPLHPHLTDAEVDAVIAAVRAAVEIA